MDDDAARDLVAAELRRVFRQFRPEADLEIVDPISPLALFAAVQAAHGRRIAQVSAHAEGATALLGADGRPCTFDSGTPELRAVQIGAAVIAALALHRVPFHASRTEATPAPPPAQAARITVREGDLLAVPWEDDHDPEDHTYRIAEVVRVGEEGLQVWAYSNSFATVPEAVDPSGLRRIRVHESLGGPADVPWDEFATWRAVPVRRR